MTYHRKKLPTDRKSVTHRFTILTAKGERVKIYLTVGLFKDGSPGEFFVKSSDEDVQGAANAMAVPASIALQAGVPLDTLCRHLIRVRYEPSGKFLLADDEKESMPDWMRSCTSIADAAARWLWWKHGTGEAI